MVKKLERLWAFVPSFYGRTGNAVNERQLLMAVASRVKKCYVVSFVGFTQAFLKDRDDLKENLPKNMTIIPIPLLEVNFLAVYMAILSFSCFLSLFLLILNPVS